MQKNQKELSLEIKQDIKVVSYIGRLPSLCFEQKQDLCAELSQMYDCQAKPFKYVDSLSLKCQKEEAQTIERILQKEYRLQRSDILFIQESVHCRQKKSCRANYPFALTNLSMIGVYDAQLYAKGEGVKVAVIDTGVDYCHIELAGACANSYDFTSESELAIDDNGSGTGIAGIIAGLTVGISPKCMIYPVKAFCSRGYGFEDDVLHALEFAIEEEADVINLSFSVPKPSYESQEIIDTALQRGITIVAPAGNKEEELCNVEQALHKEIIYVASVDYDKRRLQLSNFNVGISISAPGFAEISSNLNSSYCKSLGAGIATAHVTGVVAMLKSLSKKISPRDIKHVIKETAEILDPWNIESEKLYGAGLVQADNAVNYVITKIFGNLMKNESRT